MKYGVLDIENVGEPWDGQLICVGWRDRAYTPDELDGEYAHVLDELADPDIAKVVFTKHDHRWLRLRGYKVEGVIIDVQSLAWVVDENTDLDLATVSRLYGGVAKEPRIFQRGGWPHFRCDDGTVVRLEDAPVDQVQTYNEGDLASTDATFQALMRRIAFEGDDLDSYVERDVLPFTPVLLDMECRGIPVNVDGARELRAKLDAEIANLERDLHDTAELPDDFNLASSTQLGLFLFGKTFDLKRKLRITPEQRAGLKDCEWCAGPCELPEHYELPAGFTVTSVGRDYVHGTQSLVGKGFKPRAFTKSCTEQRGSHRHTLAECTPAVDTKTLRVYHGDDLWVQSYVELSKRRTIVNTFLAAIEEQSHRGRLFGRFNQTGTATGRLSSSGPNLQNIPSRGELGRAVRELFVPAPGMVFLHGDYSQLEPRLMAHLSGDPVLTDIFLNGEDVYLRTAQEIWNDASIGKDDERRAVTKVYVLALGYGAGPPKLREQLAVEGYFVPLHEVEEHFARLQDVYRVFFDYKDTVVERARQVGYVDTLAGHRRRIHFGKARSWRDLHGREGRQTANAEVQGSAADVVERTMVNLAREFPAEPRLLVQVHDELLLEAKRGVERRIPGLLQRIEDIATREHGFALSVPLVFKPRLVRSWAEGK